MLEDVGYAGAVGRRGTERDVEDFVVIFVFEKEHAGTALVVAEEVAVCMDIVNLLFLQQGIGFAMFCVHFCISFLVFLYYFRFYAVKNGPQCRCWDFLRPCRFYSSLSVSAAVFSVSSTCSFTSSFTALFCAFFLCLCCSGLCHHCLKVRADALCLGSHDSLELFSGQQKVEAGQVDDEAFGLFHQVRQKVLERDGCQTEFCLRIRTEFLEFTNIGKQRLEDVFVLVFDVRDAHVWSRVGRIEFALCLGDVDGKDEFASHQVDKHFFFEFTQVLHALGIVSSLIWFAELLQEINYSELYARVEDWKMLFVHFFHVRFREDLLQLDAAGLIAFVEDDHVDTFCVEAHIEVRHLLAQYFYGKQRGILLYIGFCKFFSCFFFGKHIYLIVKGFRIALYVWEFRDLGKCDIDDSML